jgi:AcrR family transcriptional regulator
MVQKSAKGRPRGFDAGTVLGQARDTFWRHGYDATSMDRIAAATGLHKPSLYGAFGDKKRLYLEALNTYLEEAREQFGAALRLPDLWESLDDLNRRAIAMFTRDGTAAGCFMMSTAIPVTADHEEIMAAVRGSMDELDRALDWRFKRAIEAGQIPAGADVAGLTRLIVTGHYELSARARAGYGPDELAALAEATVRMARKLAG